MTVKGIDVASYQPTSYDTDGITFVFIKATEGTSYVNPKQAGQTAHAREHNLVCGFYHFLHPGNIAAQARYFVDRCASLPGDILACDWESSSAGAASGAEKDTFIKAVKELRPDHRVVLYCNTTFWKQRDTTSYAGDGLWIADPSAPTGKPRIQAPWLFHQYSISGGMDRNLANFTSQAALRAWAAGTGSTSTEQEDDMQLNDKVTLNGWVPKQWPKDEGLADGTISVQTALGSGYGYARQAAQNSAAVLAQLGAQQATIERLVTALGDGGGLTAAEIQAAAEAGAQAALDRLGAALTDDTEES